MSKAYTKDILCTIRKNAKRFIAIMAITALGLTAFTGITATVKDFYKAGDRYFDRQRLFDIKIISPLGLVDEDIGALQKVEGVRVAVAAYSETLYTEIGDLRQSVEMRMLDENGLNIPFLLEGALPKKSGEIAVLQGYLEKAGKDIGDTLTIEEKESKHPVEMTAPEVPKDIVEGEISKETAESKKDADSITSDIDIDIDWDADIDIDIDIEQEDTPSAIRCAEYTIVGVVADPMNISASGGAMGFRSASLTDHIFFVTQDDIETDIYTSVYIEIEGLCDLDTYSAAYADGVQRVVNRIEKEVMDKRRKARSNSVAEDIMPQITEAEKLMVEKLTEADKAFADADTEINEAKKKLADGEGTLNKKGNDAFAKLSAARDELEKGRRELNDAKYRLDAALAQLMAASTEYNAGLIKYNEGLSQYQSEQAGLEEITYAAAGLPAMYDDMGRLLYAYNSPGSDKETISKQYLQTAGAMSQTMEGLRLFFEKTGQTSLSNSIADIARNVRNTSAKAAASTNASDYEAVYKAAAHFFEPRERSLYLIISDAMNTAINTVNEAGAELNLVWVQLNETKTTLDEGFRQYEEGMAEYTSGKNEWDTGFAEFESEEKKALADIADAKKEMRDNKKQLSDAEAEIRTNEEQYLEKKAQAQQKITDAYAELEDVKSAKWYIQDRTSLDSYTGLDRDLASIDSIGKVFPILFLIVAIMVSLNSMTRMVEEERSLIGTYKGLGMSNAAIGMKYVLFSAIASLAGSLFGLLLGFVVIPKLLFDVMKVIYTLPDKRLILDIPLALFGTGLFLLSISVATVLACANELRQVPAFLLRPKAPRAGSRIIIERISILWERLAFLNKVTARNIFRYKKRLFMTVFGIAGCTALVLTGFAIRDSVSALPRQQYGKIFRYDLMLVSGGKDEGEELVRYIEKSDSVADCLFVRIERIKLFNAEGESESLQMIVVPETNLLPSYIHIVGKNRNPVTLTETDTLITQNAADLLHLRSGDEASVQTMSLDRYNVRVGDVIENYLGNSMYISKTLYESLFGEYETNAVYIHCSDKVLDQAVFAQELLDEDFVASAISIEAMKNSFSTDFSVLNYVIYILLSLAAGLAFVVLFTLANINISERIRELATIKVLGLFNNEVHAYVNKETMIMAFLGILAGMPLGYALAGWLLSTLDMPALEFILAIRWSSYLLSSVISFCFALIVNVITNRILDKIDMVEALKSVE